MSTAAPSPKTKPVRLSEKGLHEAVGSSGSSSAKVRNASHALIVPKVRRASVPPAKAASV